MITLLGLGLILELGLVLELGLDLDLGRMIPGACIAFAAALTFMLIFYTLVLIVIIKESKIL